jgi:hypothetical protein
MTLTRHARLQCICRGGRRRAARFLAT